MEPGIEAERVAQPWQLSPTLDERFLDRVLGEVGISQDEARDGIEPIKAVDNDQVERVAVAAGRPLDDLDRWHSVRRLRAYRPARFSRLTFLEVHGFKVGPQSEV